MMENTTLILTAKIICRQIFPLNDVLKLIGKRSTYRTLSDISLRHISILPPSYPRLDMQIKKQPPSTVWVENLELFALLSVCRAFLFLWLFLVYRNQDGKCSASARVSNHLKSHNMGNFLIIELGIKRRPISTIRLWVRIC